ncbi:MAG: hypothetical protein V2B20_01750 [Pseudomonadota bacterium]
MRIPIALLFLILLHTGLTPSAPAFDFDDLEKLEKAEQEDLLAKAGQAARNWNFSSARSLLKQAQQKGYAPTEIQAVEKLIAQNESAKADKDRREEEARQAQIAAQEAERQRASMASSSSSGGGGSSSGWVSVEVRCESPLCFVRDVNISPVSGSDGGQGKFEKGFGYAIRKGYGGRYDGVYDFSVKIEPFIIAMRCVLEGSSSTETRVILPLVSQRLVVIWAQGAIEGKGA